MHPQFSASLLQRFWSKVDKNGPIPEHCPELGPCWLWTGALTKGYGRIYGDGKTHGVHRLSYLYHIGPIAIGLHVCHHCDVRNCVNPAHFFPGTIADNMKDRHAKGRDAKGATSGRHTQPEHTARGERSGRYTKPERNTFGTRNARYTHPENTARGERNAAAKLTEDDVRAIRKRFAAGGISISQLAREYGMGNPAVGCLIRRKTWKHVQ